MAKKKKPKRRQKPVVFPVYLVALREDYRPLMFGGKKVDGEFTYFALPIFTARDVTDPLLKAVKAQWGKVTRFASARELLPWLEAVEGDCSEVLWNPVPGENEHSIRSSFPTLLAQVRKQAAREERADMN